MVHIPQLYNGTPWKQPEIYLSPAEEQKYNDIIAAGPFVCMNPFAGTPERIAMAEEEYIQLIDRIIDELGYNVVLTGGNHNRQGLANDGGHSTIGSDPRYMPIVEESNYERDKLINLVNKVSIRFATKISMAAQAFVGNFSGPLIAPWCRGIKTVTLIAPFEHIEKTSRTCNISCWPIASNLPFSKAIYMRDTTSQSAIEQTINFLRS
jgi:ADP-heptose:LPS heptosyltransferase